MFEDCFSKAQKKAAARKAEILELIQARDIMRGYIGDPEGKICFAPLRTPASDMCLSYLSYNLCGINNLAYFTVN